MENTIIPSTKVQFVDNIKQWVLLDSQLKIINEKTRRVRENKHRLNDEICEYMKQNNLIGNKIGITDGELRIVEKKEYPPLSYGYIERTLAEIIPDKKQLDYLIQHLKDNREITTVLDIKRTYHDKKT